MKRRVFLGLAAAGVLAGCGAGRERPRRRGLFSGRRTRRAAEAEAANTNPLIPERDEDEGIFASMQRRRRDPPYTGTPVAAITNAELKPASGGMLLRVEGLTLREGAFGVRLIPDNPEGEAIDGVIGYELRAEQPEDTPQGPERARRILAAVFISRQKLRGAREIRVRGGQNEQVIRL
ncbi:hypothetical protein [Roseovarius sp. MBR-6]|jgi:hypothetical protein|uniref:hypothetical protein n=1 Tax=Roseovarius sp. MBR-6 TaxID=3156459 RepID=UPI00339A531D